MTTRPSNDAIAQAFIEAHEHATHCCAGDVMSAVVVKRARQIDAQRAAHDAGKTHYDGCWREHRDCAVARLEELVRDAHRYACLREDPTGKHTLNGGIPWCVHVVNEHGMPTMRAIFGSELDAAVDAQFATKERS